MVPGTGATQHAQMDTVPPLLHWPREPLVVPLWRQPLPVDRRDWPSNVVALRAPGRPAPAPASPWAGPLWRPPAA